MGALKRLGIKVKEEQPAGQKSISKTQDQTKSAFGYQWTRREAYDSEQLKNFSRNWLFERYCQGDPSRLKTWLAGNRKVIMDAGCGAALSALLFFDRHLINHDYLGVEISEAIDMARQRFAEAGYPGDFLQSDLMDLPVPDKSVDMIFSEGVLHHTDDTGRAVRYLSQKLKTGGRFLFYVYAKKSVIREFTDDHIREKLKGMSNEEAWEALIPLTKLGKALGELNLTIDIPEDIPLLGIPKGPMDLQRFFYWHICKAYHRPEFSLDEMNHMNFDWFRPLNCHRHTTEEVESFCQDAGLEIEHLNVQPSGITVVALKK